jgi:spermidine synthase
MSFLDLLKRKKDAEVENEQQFSVEDRGFEKLFKYGNITYSKIRHGTVYTREYWDYFLPTAYAYPKPRVLLIGLAGGTVVFQLSALLQERLDLDVVELSRRAVELSQKFIPETKANIMIGEGADYVNTTNKKYDAIMLDAYTSSKIPEQFLTRRFIDDAYRALTGDGVLAINYAMSLMGILKFYEYVAKLKERFRVYKINTAVFEGNVIILCSKRLGKGEFLDRIMERMKETEENVLLLRNYKNMEEL